MTFCSYPNSDYLVGEFPSRSPESTHTATTMQFPLELFAFTFIEQIQDELNAPRCVDFVSYYLKQNVFRERRFFFLSNFTAGSK